MDIFISYRREGGAPWAALLNAKLTARGVKVFLDKHKMENGDFAKSIERNIKNSPNFLLVLSPGIFDKSTEEVDWVREEIKLADKYQKNLIVMMFDGYNASSVDLSKEDAAIAKLQTFDSLTYNDINEKHEKASIESIIDRMVDKSGKKFSLKKETLSNGWYSSHEMTDDDKLWIISDHDVCKKLDWEILEKALKEDPLRDKEEINLFVRKAYDIDTYRKKYELNPKRKPGAKEIDNVYGLTYEYDIEYANEVFGENHFMADLGEDENNKTIIKLLEENNLPGFDIIDMTLVVKDMKNPEKVVRDMARFLNPEGGIIYIRELDDDYIDAYPDEKKLIPKMIELLDLDDGAGNRHTGKKVYTYLKKAGADKVYISDSIISTANHKTDYQKRMCDTYFSYLLPEMRALVEEDPDNEEWANGLAWLEEYYEDVESLFCSTEFYFRSGYIAGYGVFLPEDDD